MFLLSWLFQLFIKLFCPDCLRIKKEFKGFWSHFIHVNEKIVTPLFNLFELLRCLRYKHLSFFIYHNWSCLLFSWEGTRFIELGGWHCFKLCSFCVCIFLLLLSKEVKHGFCFISLVLQPVSEVSQTSQSLRELQHKNPIFE